MSERQMMEQIRTQLGGVITQAAKGAGAWSALLAALAANESAGGKFLGPRFEPNVFRKLTLAALGHTPFRDASLSREITQGELLLYADAANSSDLGRLIEGRNSPFLAGLRRMQQLASSYGWTQIMGWHALEWNVSIGELTEKAAHFEHVFRLLHWCCDKYNLGLEDYEPLFRCWNTGRPDGKTYDPDYVPNGLRRMKIYQELA